MSNGTKTKLLTIVALVITAAFSAGGARVDEAKTNAPHAIPTPEKALYNEYRGIKIGIPMTDVRTKLGKAKDASDTQDQYIFSDTESAQFYYDATKNVNAIVITFTGDVTKAPTAKDIFGADVAPNDQGMIFKMERYPKAGYWISYTRISGADAMVNIALKKL